MIKIIQDFLPRPLFDYMKLIVENEKGMTWNFNPRNLQPQSKASGSENYKLGKTLYVHPGLSGDGKEVYDQELMPLFGLFQQFMMVHMQPKCRGIPEEDTECKLVRMKMNLYPNQGVNVKHGVHNDILQNGAPRPDVVTSVFNFHTCNGYTKILSPDKPETIVPSIANSIVIFDNPFPHSGVTQTDTDRRIVLNMNVQRTIEDDNF